VHIGGLDTFGLCTIPDDRGAVGEAHRVLRPGGRLVLLEHVRSPALAVRSVQRVLDPLSVRFAADHLVRDPLDYLGNVGFDIPAPASADVARRSRTTTSCPLRRRDSAAVSPPIPPPTTTTFLLVRMAVSFTFG
jgi:SAM-dependent methyltransferase